MVRRGLCFIAGVMVLALIARAAGGCTVPVFRYALERWPADRFEGVVFCSGKLTEGQEEILGAMVRAGEVEVAGVNMGVEKVDVSGVIPQKYRGMWKEQESGGAKAPWVMIRYPAGVSGEERKVMWAGGLESGEMKGLLDSPGRRELGKRLLAGEAIVFVVVESGQKIRDEGAVKVIEEQIPVLEKSIKVSKVEEDDPLVEGPALRSKLPVRLKMSVMRVSRSDVRERMFVEMLVRSQTETVAEDMPVVFAVFGRGRVLCAFSGREITAENLEDAAKFLAGPCSCQVKELNPGVDLLMAVDWESVVEEREAVGARISRIEIPEPKIAGGATRRSVAATQGAAVAMNTGGVHVHDTVIIVQPDKRMMLKIAIGVMTVVMVVLGLVLVMGRKVSGGR